MMKCEPPSASSISDRHAAAARRGRDCDSNWTLGRETLDRDFAGYQQYKEYIVPLRIMKPAPVPRPVLALALCAAVWLTGAAGLCEPAPDPLNLAPESCVEVLVDGHFAASGWFADDQGHVVTAGHAVRQTEARFEIVWPGHGRFPARVAGSDPGYDIALLTVSGIGLPTPFLRLATAVPHPRTRLQLYGTAQFRHGVWIGGQVARAEPTFNYYEHLRWPTQCYLVAAPAPPGVSGGPWLDDAGRVAGTQSGFINLGESSSGLALVSPPQAITHLLATRTHIPRATMGCGFEELTSQPAGFIRRLPPGSEGLVTIPIEPNGPAQQAGLTRESLICAVEGRPIRYQHEMILILLSCKPGQTLALEVWDPAGKAPRQVRITLGAVPP